VEEQRKGGTENRNGEKDVVRKKEPKKCVSKFSELRL
jgi:hypothetical protein